MLLLPAADAAGTAAGVRVSEYLDQGLYIRKKSVLALLKLEGIVSMMTNKQNNNGGPVSFLPAGRRVSSVARAAAVAAGQLSICLFLSTSPVSHVPSISVHHSLIVSPCVRIADGLLLTLRDGYVTASLLRF